VVRRCRCRVVTRNRCRVRRSRCRVVTRCRCRVRRSRCRVVTRCRCRVARRWWVVRRSRCRVRRSRCRVRRSRCRVTSRCMVRCRLVITWRRTSWLLREIHLLNGNHFKRKATNRGLTAQECPDVARTLSSGDARPPSKGALSGQSRGSRQEGGLGSGEGEHLLGNPLLGVRIQTQRMQSGSMPTMHMATVGIVQLVLGSMVT
jgi:hypothetical protein